jgi:hypothetical protein
MLGMSIVKLRDSAASKCGAMWGVGGVDAGVDDADGDALAGRLALGAVGFGAHQRHVPLLVGQRLDPAAGLDTALGGRRAALGVPVGERRALLGEAVGLARLGRADRVVAGAIGHGIRGLHGGQEVGRVRLDQRDAELLVDLDDLAPRTGHGVGGRRGVALVGDDVLAAGRGLGGSFSGRPTLAPAWRSLRRERGGDEREHTE